MLCLERVCQSASDFEKAKVSTSSSAQVPYVIRIYTCSAGLHHCVTTPPKHTFISCFEHLLHLLKWLVNEYVHIKYIFKAEVKIRLKKPEKEDSPSPYRVHYRGILSSSSPAGISVWGCSACEVISGPGSGTASARTLISGQHRKKMTIWLWWSAWHHHENTKELNRIALATYFYKVFNFKWQLLAHIKYFHVLSKDFYFSCWHHLTWTQQD